MHTRRSAAGARCFGRDNRWRILMLPLHAFDSAPTGGILCRASLVWAVTGTAAEDKAFRAARSVHLGYQAPEGRFFYNEVVVEKSVNGSYFMACGWNTGYSGSSSSMRRTTRWCSSPSGPHDRDDPNVVKAEDRVEVLYRARTSASSVSVAKAPVANAA